MENNYYVYAYLDPNKPINKSYGNYYFEYEPFYIGKGRNNRAYMHLSTAKWCNKSKKRKMTHMYNKILSIDFKPIIVKVKSSLTEKEAFDLEILLISLIGRYDLKLGPLCNMSNGGDGQSGRIPWNKGLTSESNEIVKKYSEARRGIKCQKPENYKPTQNMIDKSTDIINKWNKKVKDENIQNYWKGKTLPQEAKDKMKKRWKETKIHLVKTYYFINNDILYIIRGMTQFIKEYKLSTQLVRVHNKQREEYKGFTLYDGKEEDWKKEIKKFDYYKSV